MTKAARVIRLFKEVPAPVVIPGTDWEARAKAAEELLAEVAAGPRGMLGPNGCFETDSIYVVRIVKTARKFLKR
jgi:hypothetical protein